MPKSPERSCSAPPGARRAREIICRVKRIVKAASRLRRVLEARGRAGSVSDGDGARR